jgi:hypothetical protein
MAILTFDQFIASAKQYLSMAKTAARTTVAGGWFTLFDVAGNPGPGVLAGTSTSAGVVPTDATLGCPDIAAFGGAATGYLAQLDFGNSVACRMKLFDMLFKAGPYAFTAATTPLSAQPSYAGRMPGGSFADTQVWIEVSTAFATGTAWQVNVTYTNSAGVAGRVGTALPATVAANLTLGRAFQLGLQAGDIGIQKIESVVVTNGGTAMTAGAFNVLVLRPLWSGRCRIANDGDVHDLAKTAMPQVFTDSALILMVNTDSTSSGAPELEMVICNG